ncbi:MAG: host-nuclease inhibitor Gam family protein [Ignavibacteriales bacterium]|nr:host-nuclease inhibitor Gam family protein [Ignavibacteriales bacterium]
MTESERFMEDLLAEAEQQDEQRTEAYFDLVLLQIQQMQEQIAFNFGEADKEVAIIKDWALRKNHGLQVKIDFLEKKLEAFIREKGVKTLELAHGTLKMHKKPDKVELQDVNLFLKHATPELLTVKPEEVKPDLAKIKNYLKTHYKPMPGVAIIPGKEEFSYKLNNQRKDDEDGGPQEIGIESQPTMLSRVAV